MLGTVDSTDKPGWGEGRAKVILFSLGITLYYVLLGHKVEIRSTKASIVSNQSITLSLPEAVMRRARRTAEAARRPLEDVLTATLVAALPEVEGAPADMQEELARMTWLDEQTLWAIAQSSLSARKQEQLAYLAELQTQRTLAAAKIADLESLRQEYGRITLRKARAYALLSMRGGRPLLAYN